MEKTRLKNTFLKGRKKENKGRCSKQRKTTVYHL